MEYVIIGLKLMVGLSILNVWLLQPNKATKWRGGEATTIKEEFAIYGLPTFSVYLIGFFKVALALLMIISIYYVELTDISALGLAFFLSGSILMHLKIKDPLFKSLPAAIFLTICLLIVFLS